VALSERVIPLSGGLRISIIGLILSTAKIRHFSFRKRVPIIKINPHIKLLLIYKLISYFRNKKYPLLFIKIKVGKA
jgi:hypothetical protein